MAAAGFASVRLVTRALRPVTALCVVGVKPAEEPGGTGQ